MKKEYYYNYDILCHEYVLGGCVAIDEEAYASSYSELCKIVREDFNNSYNYDLEDIEEYGPITIKVNYSDDPKFKNKNNKEEK